MSNLDSTSVASTLKRISESQVLSTAKELNIVTQGPKTPILEDEKMSPLLSAKDSDEVGIVEESGIVERVHTQK